MKKNKEKKKGSCLRIFLIALIIFIALIVLIMIIPTSDSDDVSDELSISAAETEEITESHIYDDAEIRDVMNGSRTEKLGECSIIQIESSEVTEEALTDWYFNYVSVNDYNWCMILYSDNDDNMGVYSISGMVEKDVYFEQDEYGDYALSDSSKSVMYIPTEEGSLKVCAEEDTATEESAE